MAADLNALVQKWREQSERVAANGWSEPADLYARLADELEAALRAEAGAVGWMPIETAPKDGTVVLTTVAALDAEVEKAYFKRGAWYIVNNGDYTDGGYGDDYRTASPAPEWGYGIPTHWMPLPDSPRPSQKE